jgi:hypothetical protein
MKPKFFYFPIFCVMLLIFACKHNDADEVVEIRTGKVGSNAEIIENPVSAQGIDDTSKLARILFDEPSFDFGSIYPGKVISHNFKFKNIGKRPLVISDCRSTCGCTVPEWPKSAIAPGDTASIRVVFNSDGKIDYQSKPVFVYANTFPAENKIYLTGTVKSYSK